MRKVIIILFILISGKSFSQEFKIPELVWHGKDKVENRYIKLLSLNDKNAFIVKISYSSYWTKGVNSEFIVYHNEGKVNRYMVFEPIESSKKIKIKRKRVKKKNYQFYWRYLQICAQENKFIIDKSKLNITQKKGEEKGTVQTMSVSDGTNYSLWVYQGKRYIAYGSYAPFSYIDAKYPGHIERQNFVKLITGFENLSRKTDHKFKK